MSEPTSERVPDRLAIALIGKGSVNHLHREEFIRELQAEGLSVLFIVREDYADLLPRLPGCAYLTCRFTPVPSWRTALAQWCQRTRNLYPADDPGKRVRLQVQIADEPRWWRRWATRAQQFLACYPAAMRLLVRCEGWLFQDAAVQGIDAGAFDQLVLLGLGIYGTEAEGVLTWWARRRGIPVINMVGNYDNLSSKGFRGVPLDDLCVWGRNMYDDARRLHGVPAENLHTVGSIRYNTVLARIMPSREDFLRPLGLDPARPVILFAGAMFEYHYFEALSVLEEMRTTQPELQMILRLYPSKGLMRSPFIPPLIGHARVQPGVYVSIGDPYYREGGGQKEPIYIDETELWCAIKYSDVVINIFSTMSLEACIFDRPAVNMWYFPRRSKGYLRPPLYLDFSQSFHNRRLLSYGAIRTAGSRGELIEYIRRALRDPGADRDARRRVVEEECGALDGRATERFIAVCRTALERRRATHPRRSSPCATS